MREAKGFISRINWVVVAVVLAISQISPVIFQGKASATNPVANPVLSNSCGLDIALVIDSSQSISSTELGQMKSAYTSFLNAFLPATPTQFSVTDFDTTAIVKQTFTNNLASLTTAVNSPTSGGFTNWEDGLKKAQSTFDPRPTKPNLVIFASDGNPNTTGNGPAGNATEAVAVASAQVIADQLKTAGTRVVTLGIGNNLNTNNLKAISGPNVNTGVTSDVITTGFDTLATSLADLATNLCGGTVTAKKLIDADGNLQTTNDRTPASGWNFSITGSPSNPTPGVTDADGYSPSFPVDPGTYSVNETQKPGYSLLSASCTGATGGNGTANGNSVTGVAVAKNNIVSCTFINKKLPATIIVNKTVSNTHGGAKTAGNFSFKNNNGSSVTFTQNPNNSSQGQSTINLTDGGPFSIVENVVTGYAPTYTGDCSGTIANGETKICNIANADVAPTLTLIKTIDGNKYGDNSTVNDFGLTIGGNSATSGTAYGKSVGSYAINEAGKTGYNFVSITGTGCPSQLGGNVTLALGDNKTCTIHNSAKQPKLTIKKIAINDNGGTTLSSAFKLYANGGSALSGGTNSTVNSTTTATTYIVPGVLAQDYTLSEDPVSNYTPSLWACTGNSAPLNGTKVTVKLGEDVKCEITNNDDKPGLTLIKELVDNYNSGATATSWTLTATGPTSFSGSTGVTSNSSFDTGNYTLTESGPTTGFMSGNTWYCGASNPAVTSISIALGQNITCKITNTSLPATVIVKKVVINDNGGTNIATDFSFTRTGGISTPFAQDGGNTSKGLNTITLPKGNYAVTEDQANQDGYTTTYSAGCASSLVSNGETKTCIITNNDDAPVLTLVKKVINDNGGIASATAWTLTANGLTPISGAGGTTSGADFSAGTYDLSEAGGPNGYMPTAWDCDVYGAVQNNSSITLGVGQSATCEITNNDDAPSLTLIKNLVDNYNSGETANNWTLTATGPTGISGTTGVTSDSTFDAGDYTLSESGPSAGFTQSTWVCGNTSVLASAINVALGQNVTCTITNTSLPANLIVKKNVDNKNGIGTKTAEDFNFTVNGGTATQFEQDGENALELAKGTYTVAEVEANQDGYATTYDGCGEVAITNGETKTCTITNTVKPAKLIVKKVVINYDEGTKTAGDFSFKLNDKDPSYTFVEDPQNPNLGQVELDLPNGYYEVIEDQEDEDGYGTEYSDDCAPDMVFEENALIALFSNRDNPESDYSECEDSECSELYVQLGQTVVCTITNEFGDGGGIPPAVDLAVEKNDADAVVVPGQNYSYTIDVANLVPAFFSAKNVVMTDVIPSSLKVTSFSDDDWTCAITGTDANGYGGTLRCTLPLLAPSTAADTITVNVLVKAGTTGIIENTATVTNDRPDYNPDNNTSTEETPIKGIKVVKSGPTSANVSDKVTYTFTVTNTGSVPLSSITVADDIAGNGAYQSGDANGNNILETTETWIYTAMYTIPINTGSQVVNTVKACGTVSILQINEDQELSFYRQAAVVTPAPVCDDDSHTLTVVHPAVLVNTGTPLAVGWVIGSTMLLGALYILLPRRRFASSTTNK